MKSNRELRRGQLHGLNEKQVQILFAITAWFNGKGISIDGKEKRIDKSAEPSLLELVEGIGENWNSQYRDAHDNLLERDILKTGYIFGNHCDWLLTSLGKRRANDILRDCESLYPSWVDHDNTRGPLTSDPNELMEHRKEVMVSAQQIYRDCRENVSVRLYPSSDFGADFDAKVWEFGIEAITGNNNQTRWVKKWNGLTQREVTNGYELCPDIVWVFKNRSAMCSFFNKIHRSSGAALTLRNGRFSQPYKNWSADKVSARVAASVNDLGSAQIAVTAPALLQAEQKGESRIRALYEEYYNSDDWPTPRVPALSLDP